MQNFLLSDNNVEKQYFTNVGEHMRNLLAPLARYDINHFSHIRMHPDESKSILTTHPDFSVLYYKEKLFKYAFAGRFDEYNNAMAFITDLNNASPKTRIMENVTAISVQKSHFIPNLMFIEKGAQYVDFFWFGHSIRSKFCTDFYRHNLNIFERYLAFFKDTGKILIKNAHDIHFIYDTQGTEETAINSEQFKNPVHLRDNQAIWRGVNCNNFKNLTYKEKIVACYLQTGYSSKEASRLLNISNRTLEKHIFNLKQKTHSRNLIHLIYQLNQCDWW